MPSVKRTFTIPDDLSEKLDRTIPNRERSKFIGIALREALEERKRRELLSLLENIVPKEIPKDVSSEDVMRKIRAERANNIVENS